MNDLVVTPQRMPGISQFMQNMPQAHVVPIGTLVGQQREAFDLQAFASRVAQSMQTMHRHGLAGTPMHQTVAAAALVEVLQVFNPLLAHQVAELCFPEGDGDGDGEGTSAAEENPAVHLTEQEWEIGLLRMGVCKLQTTATRFRLGVHTYSMEGLPDYTAGSLLDVTGLGPDSAWLQVACTHPKTRWVKVWCVAPEGEAPQAEEAAL